MSKKGYIFGIIFILVCFILLIITMFYNNISFVLNGNESINIEYGTTYKEDGALFSSCNFFECTYYDNIIISNNIDENKLGNYKVFYKVILDDKEYELVRNVSVVDNTPPNISLLGGERFDLLKGSKYVELGAIAIDNYDKDISKKIEIIGEVNSNKVGEYSIKYKVMDSSLNESITKRIVNVIEKNKNNEYLEQVNKIEKYIKNKKLNVSLLYYNILDGYTYTYNENKVFYGCSLIKTLDAMYVYENMEVTDELRNLVKPTIEKSNNKTHKKLVKLIGKNNLRKYGESLGAKNVLLLGDYYGNTTVYDQLIYMKHLYSLINTLDNKEELQNYFLNNYKKYLNFDNNIKIMHKYGRLDNIYYHESGIFLVDNPYILVILSKEDKRKNKITELSKMVYELHKRYTKNG